MIVRESLDFEREGSPLKRLNIGILTWDKLKPGDILQNKKTVYLHINKISFVSNDTFLDRISPEKYWIIKSIRSSNELDRTSSLEIELVWAGIFRHALSMAERIKQPIGDLASKNLPPSYTVDHSIEEWDDYFKIIQPKEYNKVQETQNFERGQDPKISMDIGNKWTRIKVGDMIECIRRTVVEEKSNQDFLTFKDYINGQYLGDSDYSFDPGNIGVIKTIVDLQEVGLRITIIPFETKKEAISININKFSSLYSPVKGTAPIDTWSKYFKVL
jgi:DNA-directed RNA polymerase subunit H (RpoH/RPB5)